MLAVFSNSADGEVGHEPPEIRGIYKIGSEELGRFQAELPDSGSAYLAGKAAEKLADQAAEAERLRAEAQRLQEFLDAENARTPQLVADFTNAGEAPHAPSSEVSDESGGDWAVYANEAGTTYGVSPSLLLAISSCEGPSNTCNASDHCGPFQFCQTTWNGTPYASYSRQNVWASFMAAAWVIGSRGTGDWVSSQHCWG